MKTITKQITKLSKLLMVFGVFFSQLSFPLQVLAEELSTNEESNQEEVAEDVTEENTSSTTEDETTLEDETLEETNPEEEPSDSEEVQEKKYQVLINEEEVTEYTINEGASKIVNITQSYQSEEEYTFDNEIETIDFTNMLYGTYTYEFNVLVAEEVVESKTITIHYVGDNSDILTKFMSDTVQYKDGVYVILGNPLEILNSKTVLEQFELVELEDTYQATLNITNDQLEVLKESDAVISGYKLILKNEQIEAEYNIEVVGDQNNDGIVDELDANAFIDAMLNEEEVSNINDTNFDGVFNILDATQPIFSEKVWENTIEATDELTNVLKNKEEIYIDEVLEVKYYINGFANDSLKGIEGTLSYDKELLELTDITIESIYGDVNENGKFAYLLDNYNSNDILMTLTFKPLASGSTEISINDIIASLGVEANLVLNSISTEITVLEYGTGGNPEEDTELEEPETETTPETEEVTQPTQTVVTTPSKNTTSYYYTSKSSDNYIKSLEIAGYDIAFNKDTYEYSIKVKSDVTSLDLSVVLSDSDATYVVEGNKDFKAGENIVTIIVTAENGSTKTYTIKVNKEEEKIIEEEDEEEEEESKSSSKTIIIILIILVIIGLIYVIFKDDEEENETTKKETVKKETKTNTTTKNTKSTTKKSSKK